MSKTIKISEQEIRRLINVLVSEQTMGNNVRPNSIEPAEDPFYISFVSGVEGDGVTAKKVTATAMRFSIPNGDIWQLTKLK